MPCNYCGAQKDGDAFSVADTVSTGHVVEHEWVPNPGKMHFCHPLCWTRFKSRHGYCTPGNMNTYKAWYAAHGFTDELAARHLFQIQS